MFDERRLAINYNSGLRQCSKWAEPFPPPWPRTECRISVLSA
jgi:hypothetical protein